MQEANWAPHFEFDIQDLEIDDELAKEREDDEEEKDEDKDEKKGDQDNPLSS